MMSDRIGGSRAAGDGVHRRLPPPRATGRALAVRRATWLARATVGWNVVEAVVALVAGVAAGSISLVGFGIDSTIEVSAAVVVLWRLGKEAGDDCVSPVDRRATRLVAGAFGALAGYVAVTAVGQLVTRQPPDTSTVGIVLAALSLLVMPVLARAKGRLAPALGSTAVAAEARQTMLCAWLSAVVLAGLVLHALAGWWWADPVAALGVAGVAAVEGVRTWRADALEDTCCA
jgi:divalent metal cation (Fe/Co/Zn/Cd) transporter